MHYVIKAVSFLWSNRRGGESEETARPLPLSSAKHLWGVADVPKLPGYPQSMCTELCSWLVNIVTILIVSLTHLGRRNLN